MEGTMKACLLRGHFHDFNLRGAQCRRTEGSPPEGRDQQGSLCVKSEIDCLKVDKYGGWMAR